MLWGMSVRAVALKTGCPFEIALRESKVQVLGWGCSAGRMLL